MANQQTFLGSLLGGAKNIGTSLMNIPTNIGKRYQSGELFGGGGALGGLLGQQARKQAQSEAIMKMGLSLLGQGPSRTPISCGQSLAQGLLQGQQAYRQDLQGQLADVASIASLSSISNPKFEKINVDGTDVLVDINPQSKTYKQIVDPSMSVIPQAPASVTAEQQAQPTFTAQELKNVPTIDEAAQGDIPGLLTSAARSAVGFFGGEVGVKSAEARDFVNNTNKEMQIELVKDLGGKLTSVVSSTIEEIMPKPNMNDADFGSKARQLIRFGRDRINEIKSKMPSMSKKDRKEAQNTIDGIDTRLRRYEAMIEKTNQFKSGTGLFSPQGGTNPYSSMDQQQLMEEALNQFQSGS